MAEDTRVGTELAGYQIEGVIGRGGMSVVYLAEHVRLGRKVALKVLAPELAGSERFHDRFLRESKLAASIDHPNIVPIYDADETGGVLYIAMRYVEGLDLKQTIRDNGPLEPVRASVIVDQIASALDAAHARGLVHRDVKPANVLLTQGDHVYVSDFGLTKRAVSVSGLTETGQLIGTIDYVAPEQIRGDPVDHRADVYSLGCLLFECLTGTLLTPATSRWACSGLTSRPLRRRSSMSVLTCRRRSTTWWASRWLKTKKSVRPPRARWPRGSDRPSGSRLP
jgi:serine/threonine protein kinase